MAERLGCGLARMAYVGDNPSKDFIAPEALGWRSFWFRNPRGLYQPPPRREGRPNDLQGPFGTIYQDSIY